MVQLYVKKNYEPNDYFLSRKVNICMNIQSSIIHDSPKEDTTQVSSVDEWIKEMWHSQRHNKKLQRTKLNRQGKLSSRLLQ